VPGLLSRPGFAPSGAAQRASEDPRCVAPTAWTFRELRLRVAPGQVLCDDGGGMPASQRCLRIRDGVERLGQGRPPRRQADGCRAGAQRSRSRTLESASRSVQSSPCSVPRPTGDPVPGGFAQTERREQECQRRITSTKSAAGSWRNRRSRQRNDNGSSVNHGCNRKALPSRHAKTRRPRTPESTLTSARQPPRGGQAFTLPGRRPDPERHRRRGGPGPPRPPSPAPGGPPAIRRRRRRSRWSMTGWSASPYRPTRFTRRRLPSAP
jgi:hypothetical protein